MDTYKAEVLQFMRPNGRKVIATIQLPNYSKKLYNDMIKNGCHFEAEVLRGGEVSLTISNNDADIDCEISINDPNIQDNMVKMLQRKLWATAS